jgi:probable HAF family extracellular repeat protein
MKFLNSKTIVVCVTILFLCFSFAKAYSPIIDLGTLGGSASEAYSVNDKGQIVGYAYNNSNQGYACIFDATGGGGNVDLGALSGYSNWSEAYSINNNGQIVGTCDNDMSNSRGCLFGTTRGANKNLGTLGSNYSRAYQINNNGQIVGGSAKSSIYYHACIYDPTGNGNNIDLGTIAGYTRESMANSINDKGQIVGYSCGQNGGRAVLFDPTGNGANINLGALSDFSAGSTAYSINNKGQIVGYAVSNTKGFVACMFDISGNGNNVNLGRLDGKVGYALSINDVGQIVGYAENASEQNRACLFDSTGNKNNLDLNTLIDPSSGWILKKAYDINNDGWIVGTGEINGQSHAFLLIVPEPTMISLIIGGVLFVRRKMENPGKLIF